MPGMDKREQTIDLLFRAYRKTPMPGDITAYKAALNSVTTHWLTQAVLRAPDEWPDYLPTAGQLKQLAVRLERSERAQAIERPEPEAWEPPNLADDNPFEQLARRWEQEACGSTESGVRRWRELYRLVVGIRPTEDVTGSGMRKAS